ncbi:sialic acid binding Ig-like lectin 15, like isoform X2 [Antennarius striatus]
MNVSQVVTVPRGEDAVLGCSFSHPRQQDYSGRITVKWLARESYAQPFFTCSVKNQSLEELSDCSGSGLKYSLRGDPRWGELSLVIRDVLVSDNGTYFCRVELDGWKNYFQRRTHLYVTVKPQILSLSLSETPSGSTTKRRLQCEVEGHPLPTIIWLLNSGDPLEDGLQTAQTGPDRLVSSVPYREEDEVTCRVKSVLGGAERKYPESQTLTISLAVGGLIALILLTAALVVCLKVKGIGSHANAGVGSGGPPCDCPAEGDGELQLVYSTVSLTSQHVKKSRTRQQEDGGVVYSPVNVQP